MNQATHPNARTASIAIRLSAVWLLAGALLKLFVGTPKLLPEIVRDKSPFDWNMTFHIAIAVELTFAFVALVRPRLGWPFLVAIFALFEAVLIDLQSRGAASCGCLGDSIKMPPVLMMVIDGLLLVAMLAARPWKAFGSPARLEKGTLATIALATLVACTAPWLVIKSSNDLSIDTTTNAATKAAASIRYIDLNPSRWIEHKAIDVTELTRWIPAEKLPLDGKVVFWRQSCDHCAKHLHEMVEDFKGDMEILLVQVCDDLKSDRAVTDMPAGSLVTTVEMPANVECMLTTPCEVRVERGVVKAALYDEDFAAEKSAGEARNPTPARAEK